MLRESGCNASLLLLTQNLAAAMIFQGWHSQR